MDELLGPPLRRKPPLDFAVQLALVRIAPDLGIVLKCLERVGQNAELVAARRVRNLAGRIPPGEPLDDGAEIPNRTGQRPAEEIAGASAEDRRDQQRDKNCAADARKRHLANDRHGNGDQSRRPKIESKFLAEIHRNSQFPYSRKSLTRANWPHPREIVPALRVIGLASTDCG